MLVYRFFRSGLLALLFLSPCCAISQYGMLDYSFSDDGIAITPVGTTTMGMKIMVQPDGKIIIAGTSMLFSTGDFTLARYLYNGAPDSSFGTAGIVVTDASSYSSFGNAWCAALQTDGKIILGGRIVTIDTAYAALIRYNSNGSLDSAFANNGVLLTTFPFNRGNAIRAITLQDDGKIVGVGNTGDSGTDTMAVWRFLPNGDPDSSFNVTGRLKVVNNANAVLNSVIVQADGKIVTGGSLAIMMSNMGMIVRINSNGTIDPGFNITDPGSGFHISLLKQPDEKILASGILFDTSGYRGYISRFDEDGFPDISFGSFGTVVFNGSIPGERIGDMVLQSDGKIIACGGVNIVDQGVNFYLSRLHPNGTYDSSFGIGGIVLSDFSNYDHAASCALQPDGKLLVGGWTDRHGPTSEFSFSVARYHTHTTGINETSNKENILIYPNPTSGTVYIKTEKHWNNASLMLMGMDGKKIMQKNNVSGTEFIFEMNDISPGLYFIQVIGGTERYTTKVVIK